MVVHAAGLVKARSRHESFQVNAEGARRAAEAAGAAGARLLLVSSLAARRPALSAYAASKAAGEAAAREATAADRLTIVRPPAVYGPGDRETLPVFQAAARLPVLPLPGPDSARLAMIHVADAAAQIAALAAAPGAQAVVALPGRAAGRLPLARDRGRRRPGGRTRRSAPDSGAGRPRGRIGALSAAAGALGGAAPMFTPGKARELLHPDWSVAPEETSGALPPCRYDLETGFADAVGVVSEPRMAVTPDERRAEHLDKTDAFTGLPRPRPGLRCFHDDPLAQGGASVVLVRFGSPHMDVTTRSVRDGISEALREAVGRPIEIADNTNIVRDLGLDSLAIIEFHHGA
ncbi:MAG: NAD-dependent epimerase/dehydratase family protein [Caulobacteraceae bacterium]